MVTCIWKMLLSIECCTIFQAKLKSRMLNRPGYNMSQHNPLTDESKHKPNKSITKSYRKSTTMQPTNRYTSQPAKMISTP